MQNSKTTLQQRDKVTENNGILISFHLVFRWTNKESWPEMGKIGL